MILVASCKTQKRPQLIDTDKAFISLSKGRCLGKCPVYDLWVFKDGRVLYNGIDNVLKKGVQETSISLAQIDTLEKLIPTIKHHNINDVISRDKPLTILKFNNKRIVYQSSKSRGNLLFISNLLNNIQLNINNE